MSKHTYTKEQFREAVLSSKSVSETLTKLGIQPKGGNYKTFYSLAKKHNIDYSHFVGYNNGQAWNKNKVTGPKRGINDYLSNAYKITSHKLRLRLLDENILEHRCSFCKNTEWLGDSIPLELDHINGDHNDNRLINLRLLCPNCHTTTPTYRSKNVRGGRRET